MKKKVFALLCVGIIAVTGCGQADTSAVAEETTEEVVEEATVVEETTEAVAEPVKEKIPVDLTDSESFLKQMLKNYEAQKYVVSELNRVDYDANDPSVKTEGNVEELFDWNNNIACSIGDHILYYDYTEEMAYSSKDDMTGFYKLQSSETRDYLNYNYNSIKDFVERDYNYTITELTEGEYAGNYCATNIFNGANGLYMEHKVYVDAYTLLPICVVTTMCDSNHELVLEDGTTVSGEDFILLESVCRYQYLEEGTEDFATFQSAIQLPADDECTLIESEGETTTTE